MLLNLFICSTFVLCSNDWEDAMEIYSICSLEIFVFLFFDSYCMNQM